MFAFSHGSRGDAYPDVATGAAPAPATAQREAANGATSTVELETQLRRLTEQVSQLLQELLSQCN